ncbi:MAG TPA: PilZ domain-containing protein [Verrucomicrobiae bacterium]|nr:PilZ domain-containing protein [Verrucomicrobiae bacterium]
MKSDERRMSPRKVFSTPVRFRILSDEIASSIGVREVGSRSARETHATLASLEQYEGETVDISERGLCFVTNEKMAVGEPLEMHFTLPRELTGRRTEDVRCNSRVVHVDPDSSNGFWRIGAYVESYRPVYSVQPWDN